MKSLPYFVCALILLLIPSRAISSSPSESQRLLESAEARLERDLFDEALADLNEVIRHGHDLHKAHYLRGEVYELKLDDERSRADFEIVLSLKPRTASDYAWRGKTKGRLGDGPGAARDYDKAIELDSRCALAYAARANRNSRKDPAAAMRDFDLAVESDPENAYFRWTRGSFQERAGDVEGALADYSRAIAISPDHASSLIGRARILANRNQNAAALADLDSLVAAKPNDESAFYWRGRLKVRMGDYPSAVADLTKTIDLNRPARVAFGEHNDILFLRLGLRFRGLAHFMNRSWSQAGEDLAKMIGLLKEPEVRLYPEDRLEAHFFSYLTYARLGETAKAEAAARFVETRLTDSREDAWARLVVRFLLGQMPEKIFLESAPVSDETESRNRLCEARFYSGVMRAIRGDKAGAAALLEKSIAAQADIPASDAAGAELRALKF